MKRVSAVLLTFLCAAAIGLCAGDKGGKKAEEGKKPAVTAEQKECMKKMLEKYDTNKDGKLDKGERANMSDEDKAAMKKLFQHGAKAKKKE
ncbi:MAG: hypothetical protein WC740_24080 [Verrucomicrobiia bacterium]